MYIWWVCVPQLVWRLGNSLWTSVLFHCGIQGSNSGHQVCIAMPLLTELSHPIYLEEDYGGKDWINLVHVVYVHWSVALCKINIYNCSVSIRICECFSHWNTEFCCWVVGISLFFVILEKREWVSLSSEFREQLLGVSFLDLFCLFVCLTQSLFTLL